MIFNFRKREHKVTQQEEVIDAKQRQLNRKMDKDIQAFKELNKVLDNGITLEIKKAIGGKHV